MIIEEALAILSASKDIALTQVARGDKSNKMFITALPEPDKRNGGGVWSSKKSPNRRYTFLKTGENCYEEKFTFIIFCQMIYYAVRL